MARTAERAVGREASARLRYRVELADPLTSILAAAKSADLIVMTTLGRTGLGHLLMGSVAEKVVRHATVPVLTVHPKTAARLTRGRRTAGTRPRGKRKARADV